MRAKYLNVFILLASILFFPQYASGQNSGQAVLDALIKEALENNPQVQRTYHKWKASEYKIKSVNSLPDPMMSFGYFVDEVQTKVGPQKQKYGISQKIPFPGKLKLKGKAQLKESEIVKIKHEAAKRELIKQVKFSYYDLFFVDRSLQIIQEEKDLLEKLEKVAQRKYESNLLPQQDVIKIQVELSKIIKKVFLLRQSRESLTYKLNKLLYRSSETEISVILEIAEVDLDQDLKTLLEKAKDTRQEYIAAVIKVEKAEYEKSLAKKAYLPDFTFGVEYVDIGGGTTNLVDDGKDAWMGMISVNVPIWFRKLRAQVNEKEFALKAAQNEIEQIESSVEFELNDIYIKITSYKDIIVLYETALLPQAQQAFDITQVGFESGKVTFLDWLDTQRTYLHIRLAFYHAKTDYSKSVAYLERVIGSDLSRGKNE